MGAFQPQAPGGAVGVKPAALPRILAAVLLFGPRGLYGIELFGNAFAAARSLATESQLSGELPVAQWVESETLFGPLFIVLAVTGVFAPQTFKAPKFPPAPLAVGPALTMYWLP